MLCTSWTCESLINIRRDTEVDSATNGHNSWISFVSTLEQVFHQQINVNSTVEFESFLVKQYLEGADVLIGLMTDESIKVGLQCYQNVSHHMSQQLQMLGAEKLLSRATSLATHANLMSNINVDSDISVQSQQILLLGKLYSTGMKCLRKLRLAFCSKESHANCIMYVASGLLNLGDSCYANSPFVLSSIESGDVFPREEFGDTPFDMSVQAFSLLAEQDKYKNEAIKGLLLAAQKWLHYGSKLIDFEARQWFVMGDLSVATNFLKAGKLCYERGLLTCKTILELDPCGRLQYVDYVTDISIKITEVSKRITELEADPGTRTNFHVTRWRIDPNTVTQLQVHKDAEFERDIILFMDTMFPPNITLLPESFTHSLPAEAESRNFIKRLFLALACGPLQMTTSQKEYLEGNPEYDLVDWNYPLATALAHGGRVLFDVSGCSGEHVFNLLLTGDKSKKYAREGNRLMATHKLSYTYDSDKYKEVKPNIAENLKMGCEGVHTGLNVSFGGVGSRDFSGDMIGPAGSTIRNNKILPLRQHGHFYLQHRSDKNSAGTQRGALLIGLEGVEPQTFTKKMSFGVESKNMFGSGHGLGASSKVSVTGGDKLHILLRPEFPDEIGCLRVQLTDEKVCILVQKIAKILSMDEEEQKVFFGQLLSRELSASDRTTYFNSV